MVKTSAGRLGFVNDLPAPTATIVPGDSSWATEIEGKEKPAGERVYENRYVIWGHISWGLLRDYEVYEDTQKSKALDDYLGQVGKL
jgi:hypothetical protein